MRKKSRNRPTYSYLYLSRQIENFMISMPNMINLRGLVRIQNMSTKSLYNLCVYSMDNIKSKSIHFNKIK